MGREGRGSPEDGEFEVRDGEAVGEEGGGVGHCWGGGLEGVVYVEGDEGLRERGIFGIGLGEETVPEEEEACRVDAA